MAKTYKMYLAGKWVGSKKNIDVFSSYDDTLVGSVAAAQSADYTKAIDAAVKAFEITRALPSYVRERICKQIADAPHEVLLVLDATTGQNGLAQARAFHEAVGLTGVVLTKLDGTAKGGVIIGICDALKIPVRYVGVGEKVADLKEFDAHEFVEALFAE